jgi:hypothetical protein
MIRNGLRIARNGKVGLIRHQCQQINTLWDSESFILFERLPNYTRIPLDDLVSLDSKREMPIGSKRNASNEFQRIWQQSYR